MVGGQEYRRKEILNFLLFRKFWSTWPERVKKGSLPPPWQKCIFNSKNWVKFEKFIYLKDDKHLVSKIFNLWFCPLSSQSKIPVLVILGWICEFLFHPWFFTSSLEIEGNFLCFLLYSGRYQIIKLSKRGKEVISLFEEIKSFCPLLVSSAVKMSQNRKNCISRFLNLKNKWS